MPVVIHNKDGRPPMKLRFSGLVKYRDLRPVIADIYRRLRLKVSTDGLAAQEIAGGIHLKADASGSDLPFNVGVSGGNYYIRVAGTFNGEVPTLGGVPITDPSQPAAPLASSGLVYIYLRASYTMIDSTEGWVYDMTFNDAVIIDAISQFSTPLGPSTQYFYFLLATCNDGVKTHQHVVNNISCYFTGGTSSKATAHQTL